MVAQSALPTPTRFVEQALCCYKSFCMLLLKHNIRKSILVRGMSIFDEAVILHGEEDDYTKESEQLCDYLVQQNWISDSTKPLVLSQYRSFVEKFRSCDISYDTDWISFMSGFNELHCRTNLFIVFKLCCLSLSNALIVLSAFVRTLWDLASDRSVFTSAVKGIQSSLLGIPNVHGLFSISRTVSPIFAILG